MLYTHFTLEERIFLHDSRKHGLSIRRIADLLGRSPSSVSRELKRNVSKRGYRAKKADMLAKARRSNASVKVLKPGSIEYEYVVDKLNCYWPPEAICGRWAKENPDRKRLHFSTIYRHITQGRLPGITRKNNLRRRGKTKRSKPGKR